MRALSLLVMLVGCPNPEPDPTDLPSDKPTGDTGETGETGEAVNSDADCLLDQHELELGTDPMNPDTDSDGLDDCAEVEQHGSDPLSEDGDGDGVLDVTEVDCVSDPSDGAEVCYTCGWPHGDPGTLSSTGVAVGDVVGDLTLYDQCEEPLSLYDMYGSYVVMYVTTMWCAPCLEEVPHLGADIAAIAAETGQPVLPLIALFQDVTGSPPQMSHGADYAEALGLSGFPVTADLDAASLLVLPYPGTILPGKCLLSPELVILGCTEGDPANEQLATWINEDAAQ
jgi:hypothetical protein